LERRDWNAIVVDCERMIRQLEAGEEDFKGGIECCSIAWRCENDRGVVVFSTSR